jgi:hypothetical protein
MRIIKPWVAIPAAAIFSLSTIALAGAPASASVTVQGTYNVQGVGIAPGTVWVVGPGVGELGHKEGIVTDNFGNEGVWSQTRRSVDISIGGCDYFGITHPLAINSKDSPGSYECHGVGPFDWWAREVPPI